jgi:hypothetical protein
MNLIEIMGIIKIMDHTGAASRRGWWFVQMRTYFYMYSDRIYCKSRT